MNNKSSDLETLRLVTAFFKVTDPEARRIILAIAEAVAGGAKITSELLQSLTDEAKQG
jgi:hypothetical protein